MMPSPPTHLPSDARHSGWLPASAAPAYYRRSTNFCRISQVLGNQRRAACDFHQGPRFEHNYGSLATRYARAVEGVSQSRKNKCINYPDTLRGTRTTIV